MITLDQASISYNGDGVTKVFSFPFRILEPVHLHARVIDTEDVVTPLTYGIDYTVTVNAGEGGLATFVSAPAAGLSLKLFRMTPRTQLVDLTPGGEFKAEEVETQLDKSIMIAQELLATGYESSDPSGFYALIEEERIARATADSAMALRTLLLETRLGDPTDVGGPSVYGQIYVEQSLRSAIDAQYGSDINVLYGRVGSPTDTAGNTAFAKVNQASSIAVTASTATATLGSQVTASVSNLTAAISIESSVRASKDGNLFGSYVIRVDANGKVAGMSIVADNPINGTPSSEVAFTADAFRIYDGTSDVAPFEVVDGIVRINTDLLVNGTITGDKLVANIVLNSPQIYGGTIRLVSGEGSDHLLATDRDGYGMRINGGSSANGTGGTEHGGQIDLRGVDDTGAGGIVRGSAIITAAQITGGFDVHNGDYAGEAVLRARGVPPAEWGGFVRARRDGSVQQSMASGLPLTFNYTEQHLTARIGYAEPVIVPTLDSAGALRIPTGGISDHIICVDRDSFGLRIGGGSSANGTGDHDHAGQLDLRGVDDTAAGGIIRGSAILSAGYISGPFSFTDGNYAGEAVIRAKGVVEGTNGGFVRARRDGSVQFSTASGNSITFDRVDGALTALFGTGEPITLPAIDPDGAFRLRSGDGTEHSLCVDTDGYGLRINGGSAANDGVADHGGQIDLRGVSDTAAGGIIRGCALMTAGQATGAFTHTDGNYWGEAVIRAKGVTVGTWGGFVRARRDRSVQLSCAGGEAISFDISGNNLIVKLSNGTTKTIAMT